jgi:hypothetical protein
MKGCHFFKCFFFIYWDNYMNFNLYFVNMICQICWFAYVESFFHLRDKSHLIMVHAILLCYSISFASIVFEDFVSMFIRDLDL